MNYAKIYWQLIARRRTTTPQGYIERHHIIPISLGGVNKKDNLVKLTAREHFIAHLLLSRMYPRGSIPWIKMQKALMRMYSVSLTHHRYSPSKWYSYCRESISKANSINQSGKGNSQYGKIWVHNDLLKKSTSIHRDELSKYLTEGWVVGRILNWNKHQKKKEKKEKKTRRLIKNKIDRQEKILKYTEYYKIYDTYGWIEFVRQTGYSKSQENLVRLFQRYVPEFKPQNGKRRGRK